LKKQLPKTRAEADLGPHISAILTFNEHPQEEITFALTDDVMANEANVLFAIFATMSAEQLSDLAVVSLAQHGGDEDAAWIAGRLVAGDDRSVKFFFGPCVQVAESEKSRARKSKAKSAKAAKAT
jgi:hypothetical protein